MNYPYRFIKLCAFHQFW